MSASSEGTTVAGRYRLEHLLGEGGMGVVWRATRLEDDAAVAIKLVKQASASGAMQKRLVREARAASAVHHPNIVRVHEVLEVEGAPALVMDLLKGESLAQRIARVGAMKPTEVAGLLMSTVNAVGTVHAQGIVHRDLKPANLFLAEESDQTVLKVLDFGIAKWTSVGEELAAETSGLTASGAMIGTPCYMSPEQAFGEKDVDHRSDIWSLGIILYECLTGVLPTRAENVGQVLKIVLRGRIPPIGSAAPSVPAGLQALVTRMLSVSRKDRPQDLATVQRALEEFTDVPAIPFGLPVRCADDIDDLATPPNIGVDTETLDPIGSAVLHVSTRTPSGPSSGRWTSRWALRLGVLGITGVAGAAALSFAWAKPPAERGVAVETAESGPTISPPPASATAARQESRVDTAPGAATSSSQALPMAATPTRVSAGRHAPLATSPVPHSAASVSWPSEFNN